MTAQSQSQSQGQGQSRSRNGSGSGSRGRGDGSGRGGGRPEPALKAPTAWVEDLRRFRLDRATASIGSLTLSIDRNRRNEYRFDYRDVEADLSAGCVLCRRAGQKNRRFELIGTKYTVALRVRPCKGSGLPMAEVVHVGLSEAMAPKSGWFTCPVTIADVWDEVPCDLQSIWDMLGEERQGFHRAAAERALSFGPYRTAAPQGAVNLQSAVGRRYGPLVQLLGLLRTRAENDLITATGTVIETPNGDPAGPARGRRSTTPREFLALRVDRRAKEFEDANVTISAGRDGSWDSRVVNVQGDVVLVEKSDDRIVSQPTVEISKASRFGMKQHLLALRRFMQGDVIGDWTDLVHLLCDPKALQISPGELAEPDRFFCDVDPGAPALNEEQRKAVAGALGSRHAFFVQGPPGTGKTSVICELAQQLIARGERVLLLAPTHVAIDEALRRVGGKPGVRALRLAWSETKVDADLRRFMPHRMTASPDLRPRRPDGSRSTVWAEERAALERAAEDCGQLAMLLPRLPEERAAVEAAETHLRRCRERRDTAGETHSRRIGALTAELAELAATMAAEPAEREELAGRRAAAETTIEEHTGVLRRTLAVLGPARDAAALHDRVTREVGEAMARIRQREERMPAEAERLTRELRAAEARSRSLNEEGMHARRRLAEVERFLDEAQRLRPPLERFADQFMGRAAPAIVRARNERAYLLSVLNQGELAWRQSEAVRFELARRLKRLDTESDELRRERERLSGRAAEAAADLRRRTGQCRSSLAVLGVGEPPPDEDLDAVRRRLAALLEGGAARSPLGLPSWLLLPELRAALRDARTVAGRLSVLDGLRDREAELRQRLVEEDAQAAADRNAHEHAVAEAVERAELARAEYERDMVIVTEARFRLASDASDAPVDEHEARERADAIAGRLALLDRLPRLEQRWFELTGALPDKEIAADIDTAYHQSANLVCATTTGIVGRGSDVVRNADFDTLIVDEASRVTDSEFLIGAVRARRWVLVGDEKQLPPHVDNVEEEHIHALAALDRVDREDSPSLHVAVAELADIWVQDEELRRFRAGQVEERALRLLNAGEWDTTYRKGYKATRKAARSSGVSDEKDVDRRVLLTVRDYMVRSLFERTVHQCRRPLRQPLIVQRRMVAPIADIVKRPIYGGAYETPDDLAVTPLMVGGKFTAPVVFLDTTIYQGRAMNRQEGNGFCNDLEADWVVKACQEYERRLPQGERLTVSILCFYKAQAQLIRRRLGYPRYDRFRRLDFRVVGPIDSAQGQESDLVFISFVRAADQVGGRFGLWLQDLRRLNVACTRAHRALVLVGHGATLRSLRTKDGRAFYSHLFGLFDSRSPDYTMIPDYG